MYKKAETIRNIRQLMEKGEKYTRACERIVKRAQTIENWRNKYPRIDRYFLSLIDKREEKIIDAVELKLEDRILKGEASPAEIIFYLANRRSGRWKRHDGVIIDQSQHNHFTYVWKDTNNRDRLLAPELPTGNTR
jgi:hypothetical protein